MQYVDLIKDEFKTSRLGFGLMRLPTVQDGDKRVVDRARAIAMIRHGIDRGVNYVDTAYMYHDGESEIVAGLALKDGYRAKVRLTTKLPLGEVKEKGDMDRLLDEQLKKLDVPYVDFYLMHAFNKGSFDKLTALDYHEFLDRAQRDGRVKRVGFSFHDDADTFLRILSDYDWGLAQVQYNYLDVRNQACESGVIVAGKRGVPIVVMEPLRGGALANPPEEIKAAVASHKSGLTPVQWAFKFVADYPEVKVILSGMSDEEQLEQNLDTFDTLTPGGMTDEDKAFVATLRDMYEKRVLIPCTGCAYCQPCPKNVDIPGIFHNVNEAHKMNNDNRMTFVYPGFVRRERDAGRCVACGQCERKCPQGIGIIAELAKIDEKYGARK